MKSALISIVIPAYNAESSIAQAIQSILNQDFKEWELIIVNDGSTDKTAETVHKIAAKDTRISLINQSNEGQIAARATGIRESHGEWLYFIDADDAIKPDALSSMLRYVGPNVDMIVYEYPLNGIISRNAYCKYLLSFKSWTVWGKLFRRNLFDEKSMSVPRYFKTGEDFLTQIRLLRNIKGNIILRPEYKYIYFANNPLSVQKSTFKDYEYEKQMILEVGQALDGMDMEINVSYFHWQLTYLSGMIGMKYNINFSDEWIIKLKDSAKKHHLSIYEKLVLKAIDKSLYRILFVIEKKAKRNARSLINVLKKLTKTRKK